MPGRNAKFYDLTQLYPGMAGDIAGNLEISMNEADEYNNIIRNELINNPIYIDGDIIYIGTTYQTRPEYGFATVTNNGTGFITGDHPIMNTPSVYYKEAMREIDDFWYGDRGMGMGEPYFNTDDELNLRATGRYEHPLENWKSLLPGAKRTSKKMIKHRTFSEEVLGFPKNVADKIARNTVFGKFSIKKLDMDIAFLLKLK